ncbi:MAG: hydroxyethylthiazole kinase, partial [Lachnospiraceae bacterium]
IHMIPNGVSGEFCADGLAALGARPLMAVASGEMKEIVAQADAVVLNLGQLTNEKKNAVQIAFKESMRLGKPLVLDPVGCGASKYRLEATQRILSNSFCGIVKGNVSEIYSIQNNRLTKEGIDAQKAWSLKEEDREGQTWLVTGEQDILINKGKITKLFLSGGRKYNIVGTGCLLGAVLGACYSMTKDQVSASMAASFGMFYALEQLTEADGYGNAKVKILNTLEYLSEPDFCQWLKRRMK